MSAGSPASSLSRIAPTAPKVPSIVKPVRPRSRPTLDQRLRGAAAQDAQRVVTASLGAGRS